VTWGNTSQEAILANAPFWQQEYFRFMESGRPYRELCGFFGMDASIFHEWLEHPRQDEFWDQGNPTPQDLAELTIPVLSITGMYDGDKWGTLEFHRQHLQHAGEKAEHYLVIGPWDHAGVRRPVTEFLGLKTGPEGAIDIKKLHRDWYGFALDGGAKPEFLQ